MKKVTKKSKAQKSNPRKGLIRIGFDVDTKTRKQLAAIQKKKGDVGLRELLLEAVGIKAA